MLPKKSHFNIDPRVQRAKRVGKGIVALESTVITHGLPAPANLELALDLEDRIEAQGAVPATIAVQGGRIQIGLEREKIETLARDPEARKVSVRDLAAAVLGGWSGGMTVAATIFAAAGAGIEVFATGGIGGVHREPAWDVSADLPQLARTPIIVVCAGAKAILDLPATVEYLETHSIPVVGYRTDEFPAFYAAGSGLPVTIRLDEPEAVVEFAQRHWEIGIRNAVLVVQPPPAGTAMDADALDAAVEQALAMAREAGVRGAEATPFLLAKMAELTDGASLKSNLALLRGNADLAAELAKRLAKKQPGRIGFV
jgi:pseudouridine-5'-phosphate glycosidase